MTDTSKIVEAPTEPQAPSGALGLGAGSPLMPDQLCIGDPISESPVGAGGVTDFTPVGYARVNYVAVTWCRRPDGLTYDPLGQVGGSCVANESRSDTPVEQRTKRRALNQSPTYKASHGRYLWRAG